MSTPAAPTLGRSRRAWIVATVLCVAWSAVTARLFVWPDLPPLPPTVDAVVKLGGPGDRDQLAVTLVQQGRAPYLAQSTYRLEPSHAECPRGLPNVTVLCCVADPTTTRGEARAIAAMARQYGWRSIILVTTADQAWRAKVRVSRCFDGEIYVATVDLRWHEWPYEIAYQWGATARAFTYERSC